MYVVDFCLNYVVGCYRLEVFRICFEVDDLKLVVLGVGLDVD